MKASTTFVFAILFLSIISCNEEEEPRSPIIGTWENRNYVDSLGIWFVESYKFKNDSLFDIASTVREVETGKDLGYTMTTTSWYNLEGNTFQYYYDYVLMYSKFEEDGPFFGAQDDLRPAIVDFFRIPKGKLTFSNNLRQFTFQEDCWKPNPDNEDCIEFPSQTFIRVD
jgi:hypothetical protein